MTSGTTCGISPRSTSRRMPSAGCGATSSLVNSSRIRSRLILASVPACRSLAAHRADQTVLQVIAAAVGIDDLAALQVARHRVEGEVTTQQVVFQCVAEG